MLIERTEYRGKLPPEDLQGSIFRYCAFSDLEVDGQSVDADFLSCRLSGLDWYWGLFNGCLFVDTRFEQCIFRGCGFADCRFLDCEFINCHFVEDNLKSPCSFDGSSWFRSSATGCTGVAEGTLRSS